MALLSHIFLFKMFSDKYLNSFGGHFWFISTIIQLYLVFIPLCHIIKERIIRKAYFIGFLAISILFWTLEFIFAWDQTLCIRYCFLHYIWEFVLGMCVADFLSEGKEIRIPLLGIVAALIIGLAVLGYSGIRGDVLKYYNDLFSFTGFTALIMLTYLVVRKTGLIKVMKTTVNYTYELYLVHILVLTVVFNLLKPSLPVTQCLVGVIGI